MGFPTARLQLPRAAPTAWGRPRGPASLPPSSSSSSSCFSSSSSSPPSSRRDSQKNSGAAHGQPPPSPGRPRAHAALGAENPQIHLFSFLFLIFLFFRSLGVCGGEGSVQGVLRAAWQQAQGRGRQGHFGCPGCGARKMEGGRAAGGSGLRSGSAAGSPQLPPGLLWKKRWRGGAYPGWGPRRRAERLGGEAAVSKKGRKRQGWVP